MSQIKGLDNLVRKLDALGGNSHKALKVGIHQGIKQVQGDAKMLCPTGDSGRLRNSIKGEVKDKGGEITGKVFTNVDYASYVEMGTGQRGANSPAPPKSPENVSYRQDWTGMDAQPYLYPALKQNEGTVKRFAEENLKKEIRKLGGS